MAGLCGISSAALAPVVDQEGDDDDDDDDDDNAADVACEVAGSIRDRDIRPGPYMDLFAVISLALHHQLHTVVLVGLWGGLPCHHVVATPGLDSAALPPCMSRKCGLSFYGFVCTPVAGGYNGRRGQHLRRQTLSELRGLVPPSFTHELLQPILNCAVLLPPELLPAVSVEAQKQLKGFADLRAWRSSELGMQVLVGAE